MVDASVLVVAEDDDFHAGAVCAMLEEDLQVQTIRVDTTSFPGHPGSFSLAGADSSATFRGIDLGSVGSVWWRRAFPCDVPQGINRSHNEFRQAECDGFIQGLLWSLSAVWINDPGRERIASRKIVQLCAAASAGLSVPRTLITNNPVEAARFAQERPGGVIFKRTGTSRSEFSQTQMLGSDDMSRLDSIASSPTTFQDYIEAESDLRVVWTTDEVWAVRIDSQAGAGWLDSRLDNTVDFTLVELDPTTRGALDRCMRRLGLSFGVVDLRVGIDGEVYFLEVNPQGQFAYLEFTTGAPILAGVAALLARSARTEPETRQGCSLAGPGLRR